MKSATRSFASALMKCAPYLLLALAILSIFWERKTLLAEPIPGGEPYLDARIARTFHKRGIIANDYLLAPPMPASFTPFHATAAVLSSILPDIASTIITSLLYGIVALAALQRLLTQLGRSRFEQTLTLSLLAISPVFLHDAVITGPQMAALAFQITFATLILESGIMMRGAGIAAALLASSFSPFTAITTLALGFLLLYRRPKPWRNAIAIVIAIILGASLTFPQLQHSNVQGLQAFLSDLGGLDGLSTFTVLLAVIGVWIVQPPKPALAGVTILAIGAYAEHSLISVANVTLTTIAGATLTHFIKREWHLKDLKYFALIVILCGILFSTISAQVRIAGLGPDNNLEESLLWLKGHSRSGEIIFSAPQNGHWIQYYAVRPTVLDDRATQNQRLTALQVFQTYNIRNATAYLEATNTSYILITPDMTHGGVWEEPGRGLHYLLTNHEMFKKLFSRAGIEIYEYVNKPRP